VHLVGYEVLKVLLLFWYVIFNLFFYSIFLKVCVCKYVMLNSFTVFTGRRWWWWWHWDCGASEQCGGKQPLRTRDLLAACLRPMVAASILLLVFIYYLQIWSVWVNCMSMSMTIVDGGLMVMVVVGWTKTLWNCGSIVGCIIFFIVKIINILWLLLTAVIKSHSIVFLWFGSRAKRAGSSSLTSRAELVSWLVSITSRAEPAQ